MYGALRNSGVQNLIFMQWDMNFVPGYNDLSWASEITKAIPGAFNLAFTTHTYRYAPFYNAGWDNFSNNISYYSAVEADLKSAVSSMDVAAPLVINEQALHQLRGFRGPSK